MNRFKKLIFASLTSLALGTSQAASSSFVSISDVHLNPFDTANRYPIMDSNNAHNDTNPFYLKRFIGSLAYQTTHDKYGHILGQDKLPKFIVISGDLLAHEFINKVATNKDPSICNSNTNECALSTFDKIVNTIRTSQNGIFAHTPIYIAVGNNDFDTGDYQVNINFLKEMGAKIYDYAHPDDGITQDRTTFAADFAKHGGAYAIKSIADQPDLNILSLNTVLYANKLKSDGTRILACINTKSASAKNSADSCMSTRTNQNAFIQQYETSIKGRDNTTLAIMHIPPYESGFGYDNSDQPTLDNSFTNNAYTLSGHWHMFANLHKVNGIAQNSVTFRKGVKPGFLLMSTDGHNIKPVKHCTIDNPSSLSGSDIALPFTCVTNF